MFNHIIEFNINLSSLRNINHTRKFYNGELDSNNLPNGFGTCIKKYIKYTGEWINGLPDGKGITIYKHICNSYLTLIYFNTLETFKHEGNIKNGLFQGNGTLLRNNKIFYKGDFKNGIITGKGELYNAKGYIIYKGELKNGKFEGEGVIYNSDNELLYKGTWKNGKKDGYGVLYNPKISKIILQYEGYWKDNMFNGKGTLNEKNEKRIGFFENNKQLNDGILIDNIRKYNGSFKNHMFNGYGTLTINNNKTNYTYFGDFIDNNFNGNGFIKYDNNNTYTGKFKNNLRNGKGSFYDFKKKYNIETTWLNDKKNGTGNILYNDGNGFKCIWNDDKLISKKRLMIYESDFLHITLKKKKEIPFELKCPISLEIMKDPVICSDGHTYERNSINTMFEQNIFISPITREKLNKNIIICNYNIKKMIDNFK